MTYKGSGVRREPKFLITKFLIRSLSDLVVVMGYDPKYNGIIQVMRQMQNEMSGGIAENCFTHD